MSCGLGAVALMLIFIKTSISPPPDIAQELIDKTKNEINEYEEKNAAIMVEVLNKNLSIEDLNNEISSIEKKIEVSNTLINSNEITKDSLAQELKLIDQEDSVTKDYKSNYQGYLSGCNISGDKVGIFLDSSNSMFDKSIVDIIRFRVSSDLIKATSMKWIQAKEIFEWLLEKSPDSTKILSGFFSEELKLINEDYLTYSEILSSNEYLDMMGSFPSGGTSLEDISKIMNKEKFDSIYIITDGLPTLPTPSSKKSNSIGGKIKKYFNNECYNEKTISPSCRKALFFQFDESINNLDTKINIIMMPLEGDFTAHYYFSRLAKESNGCFITSSKDWLIE